VLKYQSADEAVKWTVGLLKAIPKELEAELSKTSKVYKECLNKFTNPMEDAIVINKEFSAIDYYANAFLEMYPPEERKALKRNLDEFANKLKARFVKELNENKKITNRIRKKPIDFKKIVREVAVEANLPEWAVGNYIDSSSNITATSFIGNSNLGDYKSVKFDFGQQNKTSGTKTQERIKPIAR